MTAREERRVVAYYAGILISETEERVVEASTTPAEVLASLSPNAFAFAFRTYLTADPIDDGRGGTLAVVPRLLWESRRYYPDGQIFTVEQIEAMPGDNRILIANVRDSGGAIRSRLGNWQPIRAGDSVISSGVTA